MKFFGLTILLGLLFACSSSDGEVATSSQPKATPSNETKPPAVRPHMVGIETKTIELKQGDTGGEVSLARNIYFIFDGSGSMGDRLPSSCGSDQSFENKLVGAQWAVRQFLEKVPEDIRIGLFVFDKKGAREVVALGRDNRGEFMNAIEQCQAGGGTPLARSIRYGTDRLIEQYQNQLGYGEFRLVVVTDGEAKRIPDAARHAMSYGFPIYAIGLCVKENHPLRKFALSYRAADNFEALAQGLEETVAELPSYDVNSFQ